MNVHSDMAYAYIRKRIISAEFAPGAPLMTKELAKVIGVSRTPVRDALRQLETDGLVVIRPRLGASVRTVDLKEFREMCGVRLALESYAAGLAAVHRRQSDLNEMKSVLEAMRRLVVSIAQGTEHPHFSDLVREDVRFHIAVMTAANNDLLKKEILRLHVVNRVVSSPLPGMSDARVEKKQRDERRRNNLQEHERIYTAIAAGDVIAARSAMEQHIQDIVDHAVEIMSRLTAKETTRELTEEELSYSA